MKLERIGPEWYEGERKHGLIMGCSVVGVKKTAGVSPAAAAAAAAATLAEESRDAASPDEDTPGRSLGVVLRSLLGSVGGLYYFVLPIHIKDQNGQFTYSLYATNKGPFTYFT